jgi:GT2 family glycosyltransferase
VLLDAGAFDERFTAYGNEDVELFLRLRAAGVELVFDETAVARQHYGKTFAGLIQDTVDKGTTSVVLARAHPDAFGELQLAELTTRFRRWPVLRSALLAASRRRSPFTGLAVALERLGARRSQLFYVLALDYFYWHGVERGLGDAPVEGDLAILADELHRGPIRLLLHR